MPSHAQKFDAFQKTLSTLSVLIALCAGVCFLPSKVAWVVCVLIIEFVGYWFLPWKSGEWQKAEMDSKGLYRFIWISHFAITGLIVLCFLACISCSIAAKYLPAFADKDLISQITEIQKSGNHNSEMIQMTVNNPISSSGRASIIGLEDGKTVTFFESSVLLDNIIDIITSVVVNLSWMAALLMFIGLWLLLFSEFLISHFHHSQTPIG